jgi:hypothetical protein
MKRLFIFLLAAGLFATACNNNKGKDPGSNTNNKEKDDYLNGNDKNGGLFGDKDNNNNENGNSDDNGDWSSSDVRKFNDECQTSLEKEGVDGAMIDKICSCWFDKVKRKYSSFREADSDHSGAHEEMIKDCVTKLQMPPAKTKEKMTTIICRVDGLHVTEIVSLETVKVPPWKE